MKITVGSARCVPVWIATFSIKTQSFLDLELENHFSKEFRVFLSLPPEPTNRKSLWQLPEWNISGKVSFLEHDDLHLIIHILGLVHLV